MIFNPWVVSLKMVLSHLFMQANIQPSARFALAGTQEADYEKRRGHDFLD